MKHGVKLMLLIAMALPTAPMTTQQEHLPAFATSTACASHPTSWMAEKGATTSFSRRKGLQATSRSMMSADGEETMVRASASTAMSASGRKRRDVLSVLLGGGAGGYPKFPSLCTLQTSRLPL